MRRRDREIINVVECTPLDALIKQLRAVRGSLPKNAEPMVKVEGDDHFGWRLAITYFREATTQESELEAKYAAPSTGRPPQFKVLQPRSNALGARGLPGA